MVINIHVIMWETTETQGMSLDFLSHFFWLKFSGFFFVSLCFLMLIGKRFRKVLNRAVFHIKSLPRNYKITILVSYQIWHKHTGKVAVPETPKMPHGAQYFSQYAGEQREATSYPGSNHFYLLTHLKYCDPKSLRIDEFATYTNMDSEELRI